jgi:hypothetical protein
MVEIRVTNPGENLLGKRRKITGRLLIISANGPFPHPCTAPGPTTICGLLGIY